VHGGTNLSLQNSMILPRATITCLNMDAQNVSGQVIVIGESINFITYNDYNFVGQINGL
jgi:hypothetical protein